MTWKVTLPCTRAEAEALSADRLFVASSDSVPTFVTRELGPGQGWVMEMYADAKPDRRALVAMRKLAPSCRQRPRVEQLENEDWVALSQSALSPITTRRFVVHGAHATPAPDERRREFCIDAGQAFGTGHHETTAGCLRALERLRGTGRRFRNVADIGTGTGLLAFASIHLWPSARVAAGDIDAQAVTVAMGNAERNDVRLGHGPGRLRLGRSNGLDALWLRRRAPFDLIVANILAGPLRALAPQIAAAAAPGSVVILAGLLTEQREEVAAAYRRVNLRAIDTDIENDWPILTLTPGARKPARARSRSPLAEDYFGEI